jgi:hypothetical protein
MGRGRAGSPSVAATVALVPARPASAPGRTDRGRNTENPEVPTLAGFLRPVQAFAPAIADLDASDVIEPLRLVAVSRPPLGHGGHRGRPTAKQPASAGVEDRFARKHYGEICPTDWRHCRTVGARSRPSRLVDARQRAQTRDRRWLQARTWDRQRRMPVAQIRYGVVTSTNQAPSGVPGARPVAGPAMGFPRDSGTSGWLWSRRCVISSSLRRQVTRAGGGFRVSVMPMSPAGTTSRFSGATGS